ncbi:ureidoglycolate lyase [Pusillimonas sp. ANT_WB101]|uniref:ureidoglycolate lyase n=1 Tax=Pusillimonas sp. ANT_WB101 TaxID=2597356 RepID=UPI0011EC452D|nr:ureidoglycolate lyase [Pusillimonas sp. ANT_WB101]KAA0891125.1 ureidoglycolate lyase [Pusillimonas sp. ANT_WB101]
MSTPYLTVETLTQAGFASFGDVIEATDDVNHFTINDGNTERYHDLANIEPGEQGKAIVSIFRGQPRTLPFTVSMMERHPRASQAFIPLNGRPYLVVVAPAGDPPGPNDLRLFLCRGDQGVNYAKGVWHHPLLALEDVADFLVIDRSGPGDNCDVITLTESRQILPF